VRSNLAVSDFDTLNLTLTPKQVEIVIKERQKDRKTERQKDRKTERQKDRKTERLKDRKTERQKDRKTERLKA
jgi:hypothetical protein